MSEPLIDRYFALAADPDLDAYFAQFADDAVVEDEGHLYEGIDAIRTWRTTVPAVSYHLRRVEPTERGRRAVAEIRGDFPGSPVTLGFAFVLDADRIRELAIRPVAE
ncbi:nuclear transport factor 2 family protein [Actinomycetospora sp.]|uniref:nuclear transport factor 2 family protein n=1 Tax=Actinomycetospora sp. TaxID=1872135 RepID=UPI002F41283A